MQKPLATMSITVSYLVVIIMLQFECFILPTVK